MGIASDKHRKTKNEILLFCSVLKVDHVDWNSASDPALYNCFGFAVNELKWWQPQDDDLANSEPFYWWPADLPRTTKIDAYRKAAESLGFVECGEGWESEYEKIVLSYDEDDREFTHAAKQLSPDRWKSKLGRLSDFEHGELSSDN